MLPARSCGVQPLSDSCDADAVVVTAGRAEEEHVDRDQQQDDPRAFVRLGDRDDDQHDAGDERAEAVDQRAGLPARPPAAAASG